ncbi:MAG TPA: phage tail sheath C-terminal domain-containing protein [Chitinophagaceae bacterium]
MATYKTPGVYVGENSSLPPSVAEVETAIPAFFGFTEKGIRNVPQRIVSMVEYQLYFGKAELEKNIEVTIQGNQVTVTPPKQRSRYVLYYAMQLYFANGGGPCYIIPLGNFNDGGAANLETYTNALDVVANLDEPTLLVFPDAPYTIPGDYYQLAKKALMQCERLGDRFAIIDVLYNESLEKSKTDFRDSLALETNLAKYGAAYFPYLNTSISYEFDTASLIVNGTAQRESEPAVTVAFESLTNAEQNRVKQKIEEMGVELTPCAAVAGIYAQVDTSRGVWKAPANVGVNSVKSPSIPISNAEQEDLNIDEDGGKSINAIRSFVGHGTKIWGARTLAGNDNEWRYISVRRFFNMVEESIRKSTRWAVFEPNDANTWTKVRAMIENYLLLKWKEGALAGARPEDAFFVRVGLNQTMTASDVLEGRMNVQIGLAAVRPAEFIVLQFTHKLQTS